jgi:tricorn protease-like protein
MFFSMYHSFPQGTEWSCYSDDLIHRAVNENDLDFFKAWTGVKAGYVVFKNIHLEKANYYLLKEMESNLTMLIEINDTVKILRDIDGVTSMELIAKCVRLFSQDKIDMETCLQFLFGINLHYLTPENTDKFQIKNKDKYLEIINEIKSSKKGRVIYLFAENKAGWKIVIDNKKMKVTEKTLDNIVIPKKGLGIR